jgi:hypothetical protein
VSRTIGLGERIQALGQERRDRYALCPTDQFWFRPAYTEGKCPLCGEPAPGGIPPEPLIRRLGGSGVAMAGLALESLGMLAFVLVMYFRG